MDLVGGDTEEEDFSQLGNHDDEETERDEAIFNEAIANAKEDEALQDDDAAFVSSAWARPNIFGSTKFSVFRDVSAEPPVNASTGFLFPQVDRKGSQDDLAKDEDELFNLPSSDPATFEPELAQPFPETPADKTVDVGGMVHSIPETLDAQAIDVVENEIEDTKTFDTQAQQSGSSPSVLRISNMPPPNLPSLNTSTLDHEQGMPRPPRSAIPGSPKTPDLRPQQSNALPLPSPFPGEELSSYMEDSTTLQSSFINPPASPPNVLPDWMLQIGFGFGSRGFIRDSPPKATGPPAPQPAATRDSPVKAAQPSIPLAPNQVEMHDRETPPVANVDAEVRQGEEWQTSKDMMSEDQLFDRVPTRSTKQTTSIATRADHVSVEESPREEKASTEQRIVDSHLNAVPSTSHLLDSEAAREDIIAGDVEDSAEDAIFAEEDEDASESPSGADSDEEIDSEDESQSDVPSESELREPLITADSSGPWPAAIHDVPSPFDGSYDAPEPSHDAHGLDNFASQDTASPLLTQERVPVVIDLLDDSEEETSDVKVEHTEAALPSAMQGLHDASAIKHDAEDAKSSFEDTAAARSIPEHATPDEVATSSSQPESMEAVDAGSMYQPSMPTRTGVSFAPRVTRRRVAQDAESAAEFEPQSSAPLANSQQHVRPPRLRVQDSFEGMVHSDGSLTTAPPSRGSDTSRLDSVDEESEDDREHVLPRSATVDRLMHGDGHDEEAGFIASNPPVPPLQDDDALYSILPSFDTYDRADETREEPLSFARDVQLESHLPFTPDASQRRSQQSLAVENELPSHVQLPPTPHQTQLASFESVHEPPSMEPLTDLPDMDEVLATPGKPQLDSDGASVLSPWFNVKSSSRMQKIEDTKLQVPFEGASLQEFDDARPPDAEDANVQSQTLMSKSSPSPEDAPKTQMVASQIELPDFSFTQSQLTPVKGLLTGISYYTPVGALYSCIRLPSSSQVYNDGCVDVIAVVTKGTTKPLRADKGQRDYYTTLSITDEFFHPRTMRVQVFRPWRAALPEAERGDVVLLRGFEVFSAKGGVGVGLKSAESAAWCAWRFGEDKASINLASDDSKPWTKREKVGNSAREEMKGPPVELGEQERGFAHDLRRWWQNVGSQELSGPHLSSL